MAVEKRLAYAIVHFLRDQTHSGALNADEQESLEGMCNHCGLHSCIVYSPNINQIQVLTQAMHIQYTFQLNMCGSPSLIIKWTHGFSF